VYNRTRAKAERLAAEFGVPTVCEDAEALLDSEPLDFIDVVTDVDTHAHFVELGVKHRLPVICQKPMAPSLAAARTMVEQASAAGVPLLIHENWRWQAPLRALKSVLDSGRLGTLVRARIDYANSFPVFDNQPFLKELKQFILTDIGTHILDVARFLFGEATELYCQTRRMRPDIAGEDVATVMLRMRDSLTVTCNMSYASRWEFDRFPETLAAVEGTEGGVSLGADYQLTVFNREGSLPCRVPPPHYAWADPAYALIHASIVDCHRNLLGSLHGRSQAETTGEDNLRTLELVFGAYESAATGSVVKLGPHAS
jgi:predicted dehydrogenase